MCSVCGGPRKHKLASATRRCDLIRPKREPVLTTAALTCTALAMPQANQCLLAGAHLRLCAPCCRSHRPAILQALSRILYNP
jgi:hypothetical protein